MQKKIQATIAQLEQQKNIRILYACESGSRAWGIASSNSDYDIRFIYTHRLDWYLSLCNYKDTITIQDEELDMTGWDLRKTLQLLKKSNAAPLEWMQSPIVYHAAPGFLRRFKNIGKTCFSPNTLNYHYLSMAKKFHKKCASEENVPLKTWFYGLRTALNTRWIIEKEQMPPALFKETLKIVGPNLKQEILALIALKETQSEDYFFEKEASLLDLMQNCIDSAETYKTKLPGSRVNMYEIDNFFKKIISNKSSKIEYKGAKQSRSYSVRGNPY